MCPKESIERFVDTEKDGGFNTAVLRSGSFGAKNVPKQELGNEAEVKSLTNHNMGNRNGTSGK
jgi:hypothetical protein